MYTYIYVHVCVCIYIYISYVVYAYICVYEPSTISFFLRISFLGGENSIGSGPRMASFLSSTLVFPYFTLVSFRILLLGF